MVVAHGAADGHAHEDRAVGLGPLALEIAAVFLDDRAAFARGDAAANKAGGRELIDALGRQQVAGQLLARELVVGHIGIESADDVIAIRPAALVVVGVQPLRVAVAGVVEPVASAMLAIASGR